MLWSSLSHCSYHQHSERFVLAVTAGPQQKEIVVWDRWTNHVHMVGLYSARRDRTSFLHNELHPMWAPDGCTLAFDSTHTGQGWQVTSLPVPLWSPITHSLARSLTHSPTQLPTHSLAHLLAPSPTHYFQLSLQEMCGPWPCTLTCMLQVFVAGVSGLEVDLVMSMAQINSGPNFARSSKQQ